MLAVSSATRLAGVALLRDGELLAELEGEPGRPHSELLMPLVDTLLRKADLALADLDAFAVAIGPGSFTGLRVGLATVKGLAFGSDRLVAPVPTLRALAEASGGSEGPVAAILDAQRGEVYGVVYGGGRERVEAVWSPEELAAAVPANSLLVVGEGAAPVVDAAVLHPSVRRLPETEGRVTAGRVGTVGAHMLAEGRALPAAEILPRYVRRAEAEVRRTGERLEV